MKTLFIALISAVLLDGTGDVFDKTRDLEGRYPVEPQQRIEITGFNGSDITFRSWDKNEVFIKLAVRIESSDEEFEQRYIEEVSITESRGSAGLSIALREPRSSSRNGGFFSRIFRSSYVRKEIVGEIYVPQSNPLTTDMKYGTLSLENMKGTLKLLGGNNDLLLKNCTALEDVRNDYGKTVIENSGGDLKLNSKSGKVTVEEFNGPVWIDADYSTIQVRKVHKEATINSKSATITIADIGGDLTVDADYSTLTVENVAGFFKVKNQSGKIRVKQIDGLSVDAPYTSVEAVDVSGKSGKEITVRGQSGSLKLENAVGNLRIENPYSKIELKNIKGSVDLSNKSGRVTADGIQGDWTSNTEYSSLTILDLTAQTIRMTNKSNPIDLQLKNTPSTIDIKNEYGSVSVSMPSGFSGDVMLEAAYGNVDTNLPVRSKSLGGGAYATGKVGNGSGSITIETKSAGIKLIQR
ncbi:MAG: DUF4097 family beta strand repeat-containing protein [Bacteroidota bacterium]